MADLGLIAKLDSLIHLPPDEIVSQLNPPTSFTKQAWGDTMPPELLGRTVIIRNGPHPDEWVEEYGEPEDGHFYWDDEGEGYVTHRVDAHPWVAERAWRVIGAGDTLIPCD